MPKPTVSERAASEPKGNLQSHFATEEQQYESSMFGMWVFLLTEIMFFGGLFATYIVYRIGNPEGFVLAAHHLDIRLGAFNTAVLIASSLTMALAVRSAQLSDIRSTVRFLLGTMGLGAVFLGVKAVEYAGKFEHHLFPGASFRWDEAHAGGAELFFSLYFAMTGLHALHMIIGIVILGIIVLEAKRGRYTGGYFTPVECFGLYWHFVDLVWIYLFPLLYLLGLHA